MRRLALVLIAAAALAGCSRTGAGAPVAEDTTVPASTSAATTAPDPTAGASSTPADEPLDFGVVPTRRVPLPPDAVTCAPTPPPAAEASATGLGPGAPTVRVAVPDGFTAPAPDGDATVVSGSDGVTARITVTPTDEDPATAFETYTDRLTEGSAISAVSVLPGELCDYSGQELMGTLSDSTDDAVQYRDRIVHVWTDEAGEYLVAVHVTAPLGAPGFDTAAQVLTGDFTVVVP